jgi:DNA-binding transcriptional LysR family regulator
MDLRHLRYFQAIAEELSFTRASSRLRIAQPALSRAVQEMEAELGAPLLDRNRSRVRLTPAGAVLLRECGLVLERWEEALRRVRRTAAGEEGELRLGYIGPPTQPFLGRLLAEYRGSYPRVAVHLEERTPERVWEMVARGRLSVGITRPVSLAPERGLRVEALREEKLGVVVGVGHPWAGRRFVGWKMLERSPLVVLARREGVGLHDAVLAGCRQAGFAPQIVHSPSLIGTVFSYVEAGAGLGVATEGVLGRHPTLRFVSLRPAIRVPLVLVWRDREEDPAGQRFRELILEWRNRGLLWLGNEETPGPGEGATGVSDPEHG